MTGLVRDVVERSTTHSPTFSFQQSMPKSESSSKTGFPTVQHRSKTTSAFKQARLDQQRQTELDASRNTISNPSSPSSAIHATNLTRKAKPMQDTLDEISKSNAQALEMMTEEERQQERTDILERFGPGIDDLMKKVRQARERREAREATVGDSISLSHVPSAPLENETPLSPPARSQRKIRFADPTEADVHVYESQPSSPKRILALLPPPEDASARDNITSLGRCKSTFELKNKSPFATPTSDLGNKSETIGEGTPEDIHRRFFPSEIPPEKNPSLAWMLSSSAPSPNSHLSDPQDNTKEDLSIIPSADETRYSLAGVRLSPDEIRNLPTHLGLHHHAGNALSPADLPAGYTLPDLLLLARSTVPAQRASILGVLAKIIKFSYEEISEFRGDASPSHISSPGRASMDAARRDVLDAAIDALGEKGGVGQRAVDALWECIVGYTQAELHIQILDEIPLVDFTPGTSPIAGASTDPSNFPLSSAMILIGLPLRKILPAFKAHLVTSPSPLSPTHMRVLEILFVLAHFMQHARAIVDPDIGAGVIAAMLRPHMQPSFVSDEEMHATPFSIRILQILTRSSRDVALSLLGPADVLLRYIITPLPTSDFPLWQTNGPPQSLVLAQETLMFYTLLAHYGIYAHVATTAQNHLGEIASWLLIVLRQFPDIKVISLVRAYLGFLEALIVCATDPHKTTPPHDILWSQVRGWGWAEFVLDLADIVATTLPTIFSSSNSTITKHVIYNLWSGIICTMAAWVESASVNGIKGGEEERLMVLSRLQPLFQSNQPVGILIREALAELQVWQLPLVSDASVVINSLRTLTKSMDVLASAVRFTLASGCSCELPHQAIHELCIHFTENKNNRVLANLVMGKPAPPGYPEDAHSFLRSLRAFLVLDLKVSYRLMSGVSNKDEMDNNMVSAEDFIMQAVDTLCFLLPSDENLAEWIIEACCDKVDAGLVTKITPSNNLPDYQWEKGGMKILFPFLTHSLRPRSNPRRDDDDSQDQTPYIAPFWSTVDSIARCTTLMPRSLSYLRYAWRSYDPDVVLPLRSDWPTLPLNHLLRSGSSPVFRDLPLSWDASETDIVRASLLLAWIVHILGSRRDSTEFLPIVMSPSETIFACMKVFMLEHGQQQMDSGDEVFRDSLVARYMDELLTPFTHGNVRKAFHHEVMLDRELSLEDVSKAFLGNDSPFYQWYTDFLSLYDSISYSHPLFGRLLLPPISLTYALDYRKLLFGDYGHTLRTIKIDPNHVISRDLREYLWPTEKDRHMIGWYLKSLLMSSPSGFLRWIAIHHVACNIWSEFTENNHNRPERASRLLGAILKQGSPHLIKEIVLYRQTKDEVWAPPRCYSERRDGNWIKERLDYVWTIGGQDVQERLQTLLVE